jgi:hypothetical protein
MRLELCIDYILSVYYYIPPLYYYTNPYTPIYYLYTKHIRLQLCTQV